MGFSSDSFLQFQLMLHASGTFTSRMVFSRDSFLQFQLMLHASGSSTIHSPLSEELSSMERSVSLFYGRVGYRSRLPDKITFLNMVSNFKLKILDTIQIILQGGKRLLNILLLQRDSFKNIWKEIMNHTIPFGDSVKKCSV